MGIPILNKQQLLELMEQYIGADGTLNIIAFRKDYFKEYGRLHYHFGSVGGATKLLGCPQPQKPLDKQDLLELMERFVAPNGVIDMVTFKETHPKEYIRVKNLFGSIKEAIDSLGCTKAREIPQGTLCYQLPQDVIRQIRVREWDY